MKPHVSVTIPKAFWMFASDLNLQEEEEEEEEEVFEGGEGRRAGFALSVPDRVFYCLNWCYQGGGNL